MSCHTLSYIKKEIIPQEEKDLCVKEEIEYLEHWWGFEKSFEDLVYEIATSSLWKDVKNPRKYAKNLIDEFTAKLNNLKNNGFEEYFKQTINDYSSKFQEFDGEWYYNIGFDIPFRGYGYDPIILKTREETLKWCKKHSNDVSCYNHNRYIKGYSNFLVQQIDEFFNKYGDGNIIIRFG